MRILLATSFILGGLATACGDGGSSDPATDSGAPDSGAIDSGPGPADANPNPDATPAMLGCAGDPLPNTAPTSLTVSGTVASIGLSGQTPVEGMTVEARLSSNDALIDTDTSDATGAFSVTEDDTGDVPVEAYLVVLDEDGENPTYVDTYVWPQTPLAEDTDDIPALILTDLLFDILLPNIAKVTQDGDKGVVSILVLDCDGEPVEGATVSTNPAGDVVYSDADGLPSPDSAATGSEGTAFIFNVPAGDVVVDAEIDGMSLREHTVVSVAGASVTTAVVP